MQRSEEEYFFREGCFDRKEYISKIIFWHNRWSSAASCIKPNKTLELATKRQNILCFGGVWGVLKKWFLNVVVKLRAKYQKPWRISFFYSFAVEKCYFDLVKWKCDSVCIFNMSRDTLEMILWKKADKKCKDQKRSILCVKGALLGKSIFQTQRVNAVHGRCSSSGVLCDVPSNFTRSVRRRDVACRCD